VSSVTIQGFDKLENALKNIASAVERKGDKAVAKSAHLIRANVIKEINSQPGNWSALTPAYSAYKASHGGSRLMLVSGIRNPSS